ncbi:MAG: 3'(2'),5'-bisphosphate nucleotidase CysQ [Halioglobus sp.]
MDTSINSPVLNELVEPLLAICAAAGDAILAHYHAPDAAQYSDKGNDTPLTAADLAADAIIKHGLEVLTPAIPILSEESAPGERREQRSWEQYWLIDPLDGTQEFLDRTGEFTVNVALIQAHKPVLGVLYVPLESQAYVGIPGQSAKKYASTEGIWHSTPLRCCRLEEGKPLKVLASHRHRSERLRSLLAWLDQSWVGHTRSNSGSALKFAHMSEGQGDFYPRFSTCCEWDTAAGQAVVEAAGGAVLGMDGQPLRYNTRDSLYSPYFYAIADAQHSLWAQLIERELGL